MILCYVADCDRAFFAKGLCGKHYYRLKAQGTTQDPAPLPKTCMVEGCEYKHLSSGLCPSHYKTTPPKKRLDVSGYRKWPVPVACEVGGCGRTDSRIIKGLCAAHYQQIHKHGKIISHEVIGKVSYSRQGVRCDYELCDRGATSKGYCNAHYQQIIYGKPLRPLQKSWNRDCSVDGCDARPKSRGMCASHYNRWYRTGSALPKEPVPVFEHRIEDTADLLSFGVTNKDELAERAGWSTYQNMMDNLPEELKAKVRIQCLD